MLRAHDFNANLLFHGTSVVKVSSDGTPLVRSLFTTNRCGGLILTWFTMCNKIKVEYTHIYKKPIYELTYLHYIKGRVSFLVNKTNNNFLSLSVLFFSKPKMLIQLNRRKFSNNFA